MRSYRAVGSEANVKSKAPLEFYKLLVVFRFQHSQNARRDGMRMLESDH